MKSRHTYASMYRQGSGESSYSQRSSDLSIDEEREHFRRDTERQALLQLEKGRNKPVAFAVKTNVAFDGSIDDDSPVFGYTVSFGLNDYLHVLERYDQFWWIGRKVQEGATIGFIPSPAKLESLRVMIAQTRTSKNTYANKLHAKALGKTGNTASGSEDDAGTQSEDTPGTPTSISKDKKSVVPKPSLLIEQEQKKKRLLGGGSSKKLLDPVPPYDVVPSMRPIVIIGPSLKGFDVTDMMQKALFDHLKRRFDKRIIITRVSADLSLAKKNVVNNPTKRVFSSGGVQQSNIDEVQNEIERIFELSKTLQLVVLDCETINHPAQLTKTSLSPILVYLQISSPKVLQRLIKSRSKHQIKNMGVQMVAAEKLSTCPPEMWDVMLQENSLEEASDHLCSWLEDYWQASHPTLPPIQGASAVTQARPSSQHQRHPVAEKTNMMQQQHQQSSGDSGAPPSRRYKPTDLEFEKVRQSYDAA